MKYYLKINPEGLSFTWESVFKAHILKSKAKFLKDLNVPEVAVVFKQFQFLADSLKMGGELDLLLLAKVTAVISRD